MAWGCHTVPGSGRNRVTGAPVVRDTAGVDLPPLAPADHTCVACAMSYPAITPAMAAAIVRQLPPSYRAAFHGVRDDAVGRRADAET